MARVLASIQVKLGDLSVLWCTNHIKYVTLGHIFWLQSDIWYTLINRQLYRRSFGGPHLRCLNDTEAQYVLAKLHEGICENHSGIRTLAHRAYSQGFYWPTMKKDAKSYAKKWFNIDNMLPYLEYHLNALIQLQVLGRLHNGEYIQLVYSQSV